MICEMCSEEIPRNENGEQERECFCSDQCANNYILSWE